MSPHGVGAHKDGYTPLMSALHLPALLLFALATALPAQVCADAADALASAIETRLRLMPDVARHKWNHDVPVADPVREAAVLDAAVERARVQGTPPDCARRAIEAQLAASRAWQERLVQKWRSSRRGTFSGVPDLATVQRPAIDVATERFLHAVRDVGCSRDDGLAARLAHPPAGIDPDVWAQAVAPWRAAPR